MDPIVYFEGEFRPESQAKISVRSRALNYGLGCFAGVRGYKTDDGLQVNLFRLERHVQRLRHSARILRMRLPGTVEEVMKILTEVVRLNDIHGDVYIRPLLYANSNELSPILDESQSALTVYCMSLGKYLSAEPIDVCISSWRRIRETALPARTKATGGYLNSALARREAMDNGYTEAIFLTEEGFVSEGSAEHVFIVREGTLISPPSTADNLDGITRNTLIALAAELGIPFVERHIGRTELYIADEMFLCGTGAEVTAVRSVDRRVLGDGTRGPLTEKIGKLFDDVVRGRVPAHKEWLTPIW
jgi:branched-chain amino acid aminotransferase